MAQGRSNARTLCAIGCQIPYDLAEVPIAQRRMDRVVCRCEVDLHIESIFFVVDRQCLRSDLLVDSCYGGLSAQLEVDFPKEAVNAEEVEYHKPSVDNVSQFSWE